MRKITCADIFLYIKRISAAMLLFFGASSLAPCGTAFSQYGQMCPGAASAIIIETTSNGVIFEKNAYKKLPMASTTKIMTALCAIESGNLERIVAVDDKAVGVEGSSIYLEKGERLTLMELVYGLMLNSGNDAAVAIACEVSGSVDEFAKLMNETAAKIGAKNTHFENPNGLDSEQHYTTAYDLAIITSYALKNEEFAKVASTYGINISNGSKGWDRKLKNHNKLLKMYDGCTGVKTGYTKRCGRCLVSSAKRGDTELVAVTLNDRDDWNDHMQMLNYGFEHTKTETVLKKGEYIRKIPVSGGNADGINLVCSKDLMITRIDGNNSEIKICYDTSETAEAPIEYGSCFGKIWVEFDGRKTASIDAVSDFAVSEKPKSEFIINFEVLAKLWFGIMN